MTLLGTHHHCAQRRLGDGVVPLGEVGTATLKVVVDVNDHAGQSASATEARKSPQKLAERNI